MAVMVGKTDSEIAALAPVQSVAGRTGSVTLSTSDISGLTTALSAKADLVDGYVPSSQIPAIAITEFLGSVANEVAMLALNGDRGDWCIRTDTSTVWVLADDDSTLIGSWIQIPHPQSPVLSVNGQTGVITLAASDVGAQAASGTLTATIETTTPTNLTGLIVGNGTDVDALDSTTNGHVLRVVGGVKGWGTLDATSIGAGAVSNTEYGYLHGVTSAIQTQLDGKAATSHTHAQSDITNLTTDLASKRSKVDEGEFSLPTPTVSTIVLRSKSRLARTINGLYAVQTSAGTVTFTVKIAGVSVTGLTSITATTTPQDVTASGANVVAVNDAVTLEITAVSGASGFRFTGQETLT